MDALVGRALLGRLPCIVVLVEHRLVGIGSVGILGILERCLDAGAVGRRVVGGNISLPCLVEGVDAIAQPISEGLEMPEIVGVRTGGDVDAGDVVDEVGDLVREGLCRRGALLALLEASGKGDVVKGVGTLPLDLSK